MESRSSGWWLRSQVETQPEGMCGGQHNREGARDVEVGENEESGSADMGEGKEKKVEKVNHRERGRGELEGDVMDRWGRLETQGLEKREIRGMGTSKRGDSER
ncbi:hypothetical protein Pyn_28332 [Prunus yedoensis var. nudiflora]|uniref:Uncharacterized protein n=1 Tax=Prunus yedoensis var. nudiflora TaxID=2094558 RepID=A0A315AZR8_PRUYE|nr:hypothetical protein Pyn_28332 [Prunus yedoensis var. nudiflora]